MCSKTVGVLDCMLAKTLADANADFVVDVKFTGKIVALLDWVAAIAAENGRMPFDVEFIFHFAFFFLDFFEF